MTKKQRIEELERRVAELEASQLKDGYAPAIPYSPNWSILCPRCGCIDFVGHNCAWMRGWGPITSGSSTNAPDIVSVPFGTTDSGGK